jgi:hypothetical protein
MSVIRKSWIERSSQHYSNSISSKTLCNQKNEVNSPISIRQLIKIPTGTKVLIQISMQAGSRSWPFAEIKGKFCFVFENRTQLQ